MDVGGVCGGGLAAVGAEEAVPVAAQLPVELQEEFFLADVERALATAEGFLQEGAELRERLGGELPEVRREPEQGVGVREPVAMRIAILLSCRALGTLLVIGGAMLNYALTTWVSRAAGGVGAFMWVPGVLLVLDPWDVYVDWWPAVRARLQREPDTPDWSVDLGDVFSRLLRVGWAVAAACGGVLVLATFYWWSLWLLVVFVPLTLWLFGYTLVGRSLPAVRVLVGSAEQIAGLFPKSALARAFEIQPPAGGGAPGA
ncbi:hypothetical protein [Streptomyces virginiae]|uniref:hypothetical protein n=1 Tax=Streptomyces virginiae TaxID=1961 RepID=UPI00345CAC9D